MKWKVKPPFYTVLRAEAAKWPLVDSWVYGGDSVGFVVRRPDGTYWRYSTNDDRAEQVEEAR